MSHSVKQFLNDFHSPLLQCTFSLIITLQSFVIKCQHISLKCEHETCMQPASKCKHEQVTTFSKKCYTHEMHLYSYTHQRLWIPTSRFLSTISAHICSCLHTVWYMLYFTYYLHVSYSQWYITGKVINHMHIQLNKNRQWCFRLLTLRHTHKDPQGVVWH